MTQKSSIHGRTVWCPDCDPPSPLITKKHDDKIHITKGCPKCKRKFTFIRTDTPQGRAARTKQWRETKFKADETEGEIIQ